MVRGLRYISISLCTSIFPRRTISFFQFVLFVCVGLLDTQGGKKPVGANPSRGHHHNTVYHHHSASHGGHAAATARVEMPPGFIDSFSFWTAPTPAWPGHSQASEPDAASNNSRGATKLAQTAFEINTANMLTPAIMATEQLSTVTKSRSWPFLGNGVVISPNSGSMRRVDDERQGSAAASQSEPKHAPPWTKELSLHLMQQPTTSRSRSPSRSGSTSGAAEEFSAMAKDDPHAAPLPGHHRSRSHEGLGSEAKHTDTSPRQTLYALRRNRSSSDDVAADDDNAHGSGDENDDGDQRDDHKKKVPPSDRPQAGGETPPRPSSSAAFDALSERSSRDERDSGSLSADIRKRNAERAISCGSSDGGGRHGDIESVDEAGALWACLSSLTGRVAGAEQRDQARLLSLESTVKAQHARLESYEQQQQQQLWQQQQLLQQQQHQSRQPQQRLPAAGAKKPARKLPIAVGEAPPVGNGGSIASGEQARTEPGDVPKTTAAATTTAAPTASAAATAANSRLSPKSTTFVPPSAGAVVTNGSSSSTSVGNVKSSGNGMASISSSTATKTSANANNNSGGALDPSSAEGLRRVTERVRTLEGRQGALQSKVAALDGVLGRTGAAWAASLKKLAAHTGLFATSAPDANGADQTSRSSSSSGACSSSSSSSSSASSNGGNGSSTGTSSGAVSGASSDGSSSSGENKTSEANKVSKAKDSSKVAAADEKMVQVPEALLESLVARIGALETALEASRKNESSSSPTRAGAAEAAAGDAAATTE